MNHFVIATESTSTRIARQYATDMTVDHLDDDADLQRIEVEVDCFTIGAYGCVEQDGNDIELRCWVDVDDDGYATVVAVRTDEREDVVIDHDIEQAVLRCLEFDFAEAV